MAVTLCQSRSRRAARPFAAAVIFATGFCAASPALADGDGFFSPVLGLVGMGNGAEKHEPVKGGGIDYSPRAPLVVPPTRDLPPPKPALPRGANWPNDPDAVARRKAEADSRRPAPQVVVSQPDTGPVKVRMSDCVPGQCPDDSFWDKIKATVSLNAKQDIVLSGAEPKRDYLVEPPVGYRRPVPLSAQPVATQPVAAQPAKTLPTEQQGPASAKPATSDVVKVPVTVDPQAEASVLRGVTTPQPQGQPPAQTAGQQTAGQPPAPAPQKDHWGFW